MKRATLFSLSLLALALAVGGGTLAEEGSAGEGMERDERALDLLKKVDAAIKAIDRVRLEVSMKPTGAATNFAQTARGEAVMEGWDPAMNMPLRFYAHLETEGNEQQPAVTITGGGTGESFFVINHGTKKGYEDMDPAVLGSMGNTLLRAGMPEFVHHAPFDDELNAPGVVLLGEELIGGETCYKINVKYAGGQQESTWLFSKNDMLPRQRIIHFNNPQFTGALETTITRLEIAPQIDASIFAMKLPEGYEQVDDFHP